MTQSKASSPIRVLIMGAAGRDFHNFNVAFRGDARYQVVAFTATQIPNIAGRRYPAGLAGPGYPAGIPIYEESDLAELVDQLAVDQVVFAYSDVSHAYVMDRASTALAAGADFRLLGPAATMLRSAKPVVAVSAVRTGSGKSQTTRAVVAALVQLGLRPAVVRHPMAYGDLERQAVQRFETYADLDEHEVTIEEREEYEPHLDAGSIVFAGVDYGRILAAAEAEADVVVWDGGNNDFPFYRPDLSIVVLDPLRAGHERSYFPGQVNLRMADVAIINKVDSATSDQLAIVRQSLAELNPAATVLAAESEIRVAEGEAVRGRRVVVVEDGPTLTHGEMAFGAGFVAAERLGAAEVVDPRPYAVGSLADTFARFPHTGPVLPAMGYGPAQIEDLETTLNAVPADLVLVGTPIDLGRVLELNKPALRVRYELKVVGSPTLLDLLRDRLPGARDARVIQRPATERLALAAILAGYGLLAVLYATGTPPWQAPDEPAHFNFVRQVASAPFTLPVIAPGDWPDARLEALKASGFPPETSIAGIEYEDHQAPAWYYLAAPAFVLVAGPDERRLLGLRLFNLFIGGLGVWLIYRLVRAGWPDDPLLALGAAGFAAFLPMRLAIVTSASNDPLAEAVSTAALWLAVLRATGRLGQRRWVWCGGALLALALLTKVSAYSAAGILAAGELAAWWRRGRFGGALATLTVVEIWGIGLACALPWFLRNAAVYGAGDYLGRAAHDRVVVGQPTTAAWIAEHGLLGHPDALLDRMATWTFDSFWGVFGWMGVFLDQRIYLLLALASLVTLVGLAGYLVGLARERGPARGEERATVFLLGLALVAAVAGYAWWNLSFVQHQGRYLFPALGAIAAGFMLGLRELARWLTRRLGRPTWARRAEALALGGFDLALAVLACLSLTRYIVPGLR